MALLHGAARRLRETVGSNVYGYYKPDEAMLAGVGRDGAGRRSARTSTRPSAEGRALGVGAVVDLALRA